MSIHKAFGCGQPQTEFIFVGQQADYSSYEKRIAYLEGQVEGYKEAYERDIAKLTDVAKKNKMLAEKNNALVDLFKGTLRTLISNGRVSREEVIVIRDKVEKTLPIEDQRLIQR